MKTLISLFVALLASLVGCSAGAATLKATYEFSGNLNPDESGVPALSPADPLGQNGFFTDTVFGQMDSVYRFLGNSTPTSQQAGFTLNVSGLITPNSYSVELVFSFDGLGGYRRILDTFDRQSDSGFYVDPGSHLNVFPNSGSGPNTFTAGYHHVILTVAPDGTVKGYIDGLTDLTTNSTVMNISNSPTSTLTFFLDNVVAGGQGEFSSGNIAQLRLYDGVLTDAEALALSQNPLVPEPATVVLLSLGGLIVGRRAIRRFR